jgi:RNA polymerase sigma-70 factor (ECF subfamily)
MRRFFCFSRIPLTTSLQHNEAIIGGLLLDRPQAMQQVFDLYYAPLCRYAARYTAGMPVAEEVVSDVLYKIWQNRHTGYRAETFREYLFTATRNTALNYLKQQHNRKELADSWAEQLRHELIEETPLDTLIADELQQKVDTLMGALPEQCRKVFLMSRIDEMTYDEIAMQMDISVNTVKYHIKTALQKLRAGMERCLVWLILLWKIIF